MRSWLLVLAVVVTFATALVGGLAVQFALSGANTQIWALTALAVVFTAMLGLVPRLKPIEARFGPFLCFASGLMVAFLSSCDLTRTSAATRRVIELGMVGLWVVFGCTILTILWPIVRRASAVHAWILVACALAWLVAYFSGEAGSGGEWADALVARFGWDPRLAEAAVVGMRKATHFTFYGVVSLVGWFLARAGDAKRPAAAAFGLGLAIAHALFDEGRQLTAPGRSGSGWDVLLDFSGALVFVAIAWIRTRERSG